MPIAGKDEVEAAAAATRRFNEWGRTFAAQYTAYEQEHNENSRHADRIWTFYQVYEHRDEFVLASESGATEEYETFPLAWLWADDWIALLEARNAETARRLEADRQHRLAAWNQEKEEHERAEYERLKQKYGARA